MDFGGVRIRIDVDSPFENTHDSCVHAHVAVYTYLTFIMTGQNISNDGDKSVQICISPTFNEPIVYQGIKVWRTSMLDARQRP